MDQPRDDFPGTAVKKIIERLHLCRGFQSLGRCNGFVQFDLTLIRAGPAISAGPLRAAVQFVQLVRELTASHIERSSSGNEAPSRLIH